MPRIEVANPVLPAPDITEVVPEANADVETVAFT